MWWHGTYENDQSRNTKINSDDARHRRASNGCINFDDLLFGEIYNHWKIWCILYITFEPSAQEINNFIRNNR